jgi:hypothetical protein
VAHVIEQESVKLLPTASFLLALVLIASGAGLTQSRPTNNLANELEVRVVQLTLQDFSGSKVVIGVGLAATCKRNLTVDQVVFSGLRINGVAIYAAPYKHRFSLRRDSTVVLPEPLMVTLDLRDLNSLKSLRKAISDGHATLEGVASIRSPLSPMAKLMLFSGHAEITRDLHQEVAIDIPGAAMVSKILDFAGAGLRVIDSAIR